MRLGYVIVYVPHVEAAVEFYERAFDVQRRFIHESGAYAELETGSTALAFASEEMVSATCHSFALNSLGAPPAGAEVAFICKDVQTAFKTAVDAGATGYVKPHDKPWGQTVAYVRDLNGFLVELCTEVG